MARWGWVLTAVMLLVGCSTKFVYNKLDWFAVRYIEDFVELDDAQESLVRSKVKQLMDWQTQTELPQYVAHLDELIALDPKTFSSTELDRQRQKFQAHGNRLLHKLEPEIIELAKQLTDDQTEELMNSIRVRHTRYKKKYQDLTPDEMQSVYANRLEENVEEWFGSVTQTQQQIIDEWSREMLITQPDWVNHQTHMRIEINTLLAKRMDSSYFPKHLNAMLFEPDSFFSPEFMQKREYNQSVSARHFVRMVQSATSQQVAHYRDELKDWKEMALALY